MALQFLPISEHHEVFLLVITDCVCCFSKFFDTVVLPGFCQKVECHKVIFQFHWWYLRLSECLFLFNSLLLCICCSRIANSGKLLHPKTEDLIQGESDRPNIQLDI